MAKKAKSAKKVVAKKKAAPKKPAKKVAKKVAAKKPAKKVAAKKVAAPKMKSARKPNASFMKPMAISADLAPVVGKGPMPRSEVVKKLWAYIKKNGLQDQVNRRNINADEALKKVFKGKATVSMFEMTKLVNAHLS